MPEQDTLRDALAASLDAAESTPVVETPAETPVEQSAADRARDEQGRFAAKQAETKPEAPPIEAAPVVAASKRPSTWKKEYWPLYEKLETGVPLTPDEARKIADYTVQRENEFKFGVSTYKAEADKAKEIQDAIAPFMPELQRHNVNPGQWIASLGRAHQVLYAGSPQEKLQMFHQLAREYGVNLGEQPQGQPDPQVGWMTQKLQSVDQTINNLPQMVQKVIQDTQISQNIEEFKAAPGHEHFEEVRGFMAQLLESGKASDLNDAYAKATRLLDDVWEQRAAPANQQQVVAQAKARTISPKSASPSAVGSAGAKGLRATLEEQVNSAFGGGRF